MKVKSPLVLSFHTGWSRIPGCSCSWVAKSLWTWSRGASWMSFGIFHCPCSIKSATVSLLNMLLSLVKCTSAPIPSQLSYQIEQEPDLIFHWIWFSTLCLFCIMCLQAWYSPVCHFLQTGLDLWQYFALRKSPIEFAPNLIVGTHLCAFRNDGAMK